MTQLDLFGTAAAPASQPQRIDLPLLLAASPHHTLGGALPALPAKPAAPALDVQPNEHGVYPHDLAERLTLPCTRKNWQGGPTAEIRLLHTLQGWIYGMDYNTETSGGTSPLSAGWEGFLPDRATALNMARKELLRRVERKDDKSAARIRAWLPTLL
jgi:hypothetical protein